MALPVTITGFTPIDGTVCGPYKSSAGNYYIVGSDSNAVRARIIKASDPTSSFSEISVGSTYSGTIEDIAAYQADDVIHICVGNKTSSNLTSYHYLAFDMSSDTLTVSEDAALNLNTVAVINESRCGIVVRSNGEVVIHGHGLFAKIMGTNYPQTYWSRRTGTDTWTAMAAVTPLDENIYRFPRCVLGASDAVHMLFAVGNNARQRTLSSGNALQTESTPVTVGASGNLQVCSGISYDSGGTQKCAILWSDNDTSNGIGVVRFDSGNTPTLNSAVVEAASASRALFVDTGDSNKLWCPYVFNSDGDLYSERSTDNGATWGTKTSARVVAYVRVCSRDGVLYQRGSNFVLPFVTVDGSATLRYDEINARASATAWAGSTVFAGTAAIAANTRARLVGRATLAATSAFAVNATRTIPATASFAGSSTLDADLAKPPHIATSAFAGASNISAVTSRALRATAAFAGANALSAQTAFYLRATGTFAGASTLAATARLALAGQAQFAGSATLSSNTLRYLNDTAELFALASSFSTNAVPLPKMAEAVFAGASALSATARLAAVANLQFTGASALAAQAARWLPARAAFAKAASFTVEALRYSPISAVFVGSVALAADATKQIGGVEWQGTAAFAAAGDLAAVASIALSATTRFDGTSWLSTDTSKWLQATAAFAATPTLSAFTAAALRAAATFNGASIFVTDSELKGTVQANAVFPASSLLNTTALRFSTGTTIFAASAALAANSALYKNANTIFAGSNALSTLALRYATGSSIFAGASTFAAASLRFSTGTALLTGAAILSAGARGKFVAYAAFAGSSAWAASAEIAGSWQAVSLFAASSSLAATASRRLAASSVLPAGIALATSTRGRLSARSALAASSVLSAPLLQRFATAAKLPASSAIASNATISGAVFEWAGSALLVSSSALLANIARYIPTAAAYQASASFMAANKVALAARAGLLAGSAINATTQQFLIAHGALSAFSSINVADTLTALTASTITTTSMLAVDTNLRQKFRDRRFAYRIAADSVIDADVVVAKKTRTQFQTEAFRDN